jgi:hypothetical protein
MSYENFALKFLNIISRSSSSARSLSLTSSISSIVDPALVYTNILNNIRKANSFSFLRQIVSLPAIDSYYKSHILSIATEKYITIDIFRNSMFRQNFFDFGQDLAKSTGGLYVRFYNKTQADINGNTNEQVELIDFKYSMLTSNDITITVDITCTSLLLEIVTDDPMASLTIQLQQSNIYIVYILILTCEVLLILTHLSLKD